MAVSLPAAHQLPPPARKENGVENYLKWVYSVVLNFSAKILRCPETVLISAEFNSCQSVAD